jgi:hypothetical protein
MKIIYEPIEAESTIITKGLKSLDHFELRAKVNDSLLLPACEELLRFVVDYISQEGAKILHDETLMYGYWMIKFRLSSEKTLDVWEYKPDASGFIEGADQTLRYWIEQHEVCGANHAVFCPPRPDQKVAISDGVYEGEPVEGVRYPSPEHMSGWWLTTDRYDGDIKSLKVVHLYHVTAVRPDIAKLIALPYGFRFLTNPLNIWFDKNAGP